MTDQSKDRVGYCSPPIATRWKKGQSGNPRGRGPAKRRKTRRQIAEDVVRRTVIHDGRTLTYLDIILIQVFNKASQGNKRALRLLERIEEYRRATPEIWLVTPKTKEQLADEYEKAMNDYARSREEFTWEGGTITPDMTVKEAAEAYERTKKLLSMKDDDDDD